MDLQRLLVIAMLACAGSQLDAQERLDPKPKAKEIDKTTIEAWNKRGFEVGWIHEQRGRAVLTPEYPKDARDALPAIWFRDSKRDLTDDDLKDLPPVEFPFALHLAVCRNLTDGGLEHIANLTNLVWLDVGSTLVGGDGLKHLAGLKNLTTLRLSCSRSTDVAAMNLARFKSLSKLELDGTKVTDDGLKDLAAIKSLSTLHLSGAPITDGGLRHLAKLTNLTELDLNNTEISDEGLKHLANLANLATLNVWDTDVTGANLKSLAGLKKLTTFGIENMKVTDDLVKALSEAGLLHALFQVEPRPAAEHIDDGKRPAKPEDVRRVNLAGTQVTAAGLKYFAEFPNLTDLHLGEPQITPDGMKKLTGFANLTFLTLATTKQAGDGLKHLAGMKKLSAVYISGTEMTSEDVKRLADIKSLDFISLPITDEAVQALSEARMLHMLIHRAKTADGKLPTTDDEIASLDLSRGLMKGEGLKYVAKLKNIVTVNVRDTPVTMVWLDDFRKTLPKCEIVR
jgi:internalin A